MVPVQESLEHLIDLSIQLAKVRNELAGLRRYDDRHLEDAADSRKGLTHLARILSLVRDNCREQGWLLKNSPTGGILSWGDFPAGYRAFFFGSAPGLLFSILFFRMVAACKNESGQFVRFFESAV